MEKKSKQKIVKTAYGKIASGQEGCGCGTTNKSTAKEFAQSLGYTEEDLNDIPLEANLALSCGNPLSTANLKEGEIVLDLGSGAGFDCFMAAKKVGALGRVIGVDMTPEMIDKAKENAAKYGIRNVEFILGEIENLPLADNSVDVVISNCVINLSEDKQRTLHEVFRVLKPGGRIAISDIALLKDLPEYIRENKDAYVACIAGAVLVDEYEELLKNAGLKDIRITAKKSSICAKESYLAPQENEPSNCCNDDSVNGSITGINVEGFKRL